MFSQTFLKLRFSLGNEGKDGKNLNSQTWPGSPRRPSPRHMKRGESAFSAPNIETFIARTEADFENRPCARENCAKLVRGAFPTGPRKFVRKMCGGIRKCAEIVRNLCGGALAHFAQNTGVGLPRMCVRKFRAIFC